MCVCVPVFLSVTTPVSDCKLMVYFAENSWMRNLEFPDPEMTVKIFMGIIHSFIPQIFMEALYVPGSLKK